MCCREEVSIKPLEVVEVGPFTTANKLERWYEKRIKEKGLVVVSRRMIEDLSRSAARRTT
jgi:hypothetical protein